MESKHEIPKSKTRDLIAVWNEFNQLALKYGNANFSHGVPGLGPPKFLTETMKEVIDIPANNHYSPVIGHATLRSEIAKWWSPYFNGRELNPATDVLVTTGAIGAVYCIIENLCTKGDTVHMFEPYYTCYINCIEFAGANCSTSPMYTDKDGNWHFDFDHFEKSLNENSRLLILNNPHNPTGRLFTDEEMQRMTKILEKWPKVTVLNDEVYFFLPFDGKKMLSFANYGDNWHKTINVYSARKMLNCTGWKVGWAIGPAALVKQAFYVHESSSFNSNVPGQVAIAKVMETMWTKEYEGHKNYFEYCVKVFEEGRAGCTQMLEKATGLKFTPTKVESGYFMCVDVTGCEDKIPAKYFAKNENYEDDKDTVVRQMQFPEHFDKVPLDFAVCRYLAVECGISCMPVTNFCLHESEHRLERFIRIAICRPGDQFNNPNMMGKFEKL